MTRPDVWKACAPWDALEMGWGTRRELLTGTIAHPSTNAANTHGVPSIWRPGCLTHFSNISIIRANYLCVCVYLWIHTASTAVTERWAAGRFTWRKALSCVLLLSRNFWSMDLKGSLLRDGSCSFFSDGKHWGGPERERTRDWDQNIEKICREKTLPASPNGLLK